MVNPLVVFLDPASIPGVTPELPLALTPDGRKLQTATEMVNQVLIVVFLDDTSPDLPALAHQNKDPAAPLLLITHRGSVHHTPTTSRANVVLRQWGVPAALDSFSHVPKDPTFKEVLMLFSGGLTPENFVATRRNQAALGALDVIAQVQHLKILSDTSIDDEIAAQLRDAMRQLSIQDQLSVRNCSSPATTLQAVNDIANRLVG